MDKGGAFKRGHLSFYLRITALFSSVALMLAAFASFAAAPASAAPTGGNFFATGHDMDFHCAGGQADECAYFKIVVTKARNGSALPVLALDQGAELTTALTNIGAAPVVSVDPTSPAFGTTPFVDGSGHPLYSVIITASDSSCGGCDNTSTGEAKINARSADFTKYFNAGGNIIALTGGPANFPTYYNFVPLKGLTGAPVSPPFAVTPAGSALGITNTMANCCATHSSFKIPSSPLQVLETDSAKLAETIACFGCSIGGGGFGGGHNPNVFEVDVKHCTTIHIGYNYFPVGTVINWRIKQTGTGTLGSGSTTTVAPTGKTMHFVDLTHSLSLKPEKPGFYTFVYFNWTISGVTSKYVVTRDPGC